MNEKELDGELFCTLGWPLAVYEVGNQAVLDPERFRSACKWLMQHSNNEDHAVVIAGVRQNFSQLDAGAWQVNNPFNLEITKNPVAWIAKSTDQQLADFIQWSHTRHARMNRALQRDKSEVAERVEVLLRNVQSNMGTKLDIGACAASVLLNSPIVPLSSFEMADHVANALCIPAEKAGKVGIIAVSNLYTDPVNLEGVSDQLVAMEGHEAIHGVCIELHAGFYDGLVEQGQSAGVLEEVITGHIEEAAQHGQYDTLSPRAREVPGRTYVQLRDLFGVLLSQGVAYAEPDMIDEALFSPLKKREQVRIELSNRLDVAVQELLPQFATGPRAGWMALCAALDKVSDHKRPAYAKQLTDQVYSSIMPSITFDDDFSYAQY